jgi:hypothetical protein
MLIFTNKVYDNCNIAEFILVYSGDHRNIKTHARNERLESFS